MTAVNWHTGHGISDWNPTRGHNAAAHYVRFFAKDGRPIEFYVGICECGWVSKHTRLTAVMAEQDAENHITQVRWAPTGGKDART